MLSLRRSTHGVSASFLIRADDGRDYWCKAINNPTSERIPINEQVVARLGRGIGVAIPEPALVRLDALVGWEFHPGKMIETGWCHGCLAITGVFEIRNLEHRADDDNRARHAGFYALMDWLAGGDQQWLYAAPAENAYYSHDHGHFFPGGPDWTSAALSATGVSERLLGVPSDGLDREELLRLADALEGTSLDDIEAVMSRIPVSWPVSDQDLAELAAFVDARSVPVAARLRSLVP